MELRVLQYFLAAAREQSISGAAEFLHLTQPTLSRQLKDLEEELGTTLFIRGNRKISLTEDGMYLRKRAEEIVELARKTKADLSMSDNIIAGDVHIGAGETDGIREIAKIIKSLKNDYPDIKFHISSDDSKDIFEDLDKGLIDFGLIIGNPDISKYDSIKIPVQDTWGVLMLKNNPLARKDFIIPEDIITLPLLLSRQIKKNDDVSKWLGVDINNLNIVATYNLIFNAAIMVHEGIGCALTLDKLVNTSGDSPYAFVPLINSPSYPLHVIWKKYQVFSKASEKFLEYLKNTFEGNNNIDM